MKMFIIVGEGDSADVNTELSGLSMAYEIDLSEGEVDEMFELKVGEKLVLDADLTIKRVS